MKLGCFSALLFCTALLLSGCGAREPQEPAETTPPQTAAFTRESKIKDVKNAPIFGSYGRLLFPVEDAYYSGDTLEELQLTYYSHIDPDETLEIVNTLRERAADGQTIFYDIYTDQEKAADPAKEDTGLFFFKGVPGEKFAICNAGGAFAYVGAMQDSFPHALELSKNGYNAFVLQRRVNPYAAVDQQLDLARAIRYIRHNASEKHIGKTDIMIAVGFSAGGMNVMQVVADQFGTTNTPDKVYPSYVCDAVDHESADLNVAIPIYGLFVTGLNFTKNPNLPPVFGVVGQKDGLSAMMLPSLPECANIFTDFSFYLAPDAPHGVGLGTGTKGYVDYYTQIAQWPDMAVNFIESRLGLMEKKIDMDSVGFAW